MLRLARQSRSKTVMLGLLYCYGSEFDSRLSVFIKTEDHIYGQEV